MAHAAGTALLWALMFAFMAAILSAVRGNTDNSLPAAGGNFAVNLTVLFFIDWLVFYLGMPPTFFAAILPIVILNLAIVAIVGSVGDLLSGDVGGATVIGWSGVVICGLIWVFGYNSGHDPKAAATIVPVTQEAATALPASLTTNMGIVSPDMATTKAQQAMSFGVAGKRNYSTYLQLGAPTEQYVDGHLWYVFSLHFDGSGNKHRLHNVSPGYIMVSAEDPNAAAVEHYDDQYSMVVCQDCGQDNEPDRWAYNHGYKVAIDDPTIEVDDQGRPFWTETIMTPHNGWTFYAPTAVLVIDAHTGQITKYDLDKVPAWVDRVYSSQVAQDIVNWYGLYGQNGQNGWNGVGTSNANRYQVSGDPILVYTGDGHPDWRMLLTSFNSDTSVSRIIIMDAHTGAIRDYQPQQPMGIEAPVESAFDSASGQGAGMVKSNHYHAVGLSLHVIYGHLTWMATYEPEGSHPSFVGVGFVDAYRANANNVAFGSNKEVALQNYLTQLATEGTANGNAPGQGGQYVTVTGTVGAVSWDISNNQKFWYVTLTGDPSHVYIGTSSAVGPALVMVQSGDPVTIQYLNTGGQESSRTMQTFADTKVPLKPAGS